MTTEKTTPLVESAHWYDRNAQQILEVPRADGSSKRACTLRDARKLDLARGVTSVIAAANKPQLVRWRIRQGVLATMRTPRPPGMSDDEYVDLCVQESTKVASTAAEEGTRRHAAIESFFAGRPVEAELLPMCLDLRDKLTLAFGERKWYAEVPGISLLGYGTKCDLCSPSDKRGGGVTVDIKTKDDDKIDTVELFDEHYEQLAATQAILSTHTANHGDMVFSGETNFFNGPCCIAFIGRQSGEVRLASAGNEELITGWARFLSLLSYIQVRDGYKPSWAKADPAETLRSLL